MNNKAQAHFAVALIAIFILIVVLIFALSSDVNFSVRITKSEFQRGEEILLFYDIENGLIFGDVNDITFTYTVYDSNEIVVDTDSKEIGDLSWGQAETNYSTIGTSGLRRGEYTIWTNIDYWKYGTLETKYLSLKLTVI